MKSTTRRKHLKTVGGTSLLSFTGLSTAPLVAAEKSSVTRLAMEFMGEFEVPGLSIAIAKDGDFICRKAFGVANIKAGKRLTVDHRFRIASVSKPVTGREEGIEKLCEQSKAPRGPKSWLPPKAKKELQKKLAKGSFRRAIEAQR